MSNISFWRQNKTIVAIAVSILALAEIVDLTIVSVALPDIMGALSVNINEVSLTMTSYIIAAAVFIPLTGIVSKKYGTKNVILASAIVFGVSSVLCGMASSLLAMVVFRLLQGVGGAFLPSLAQAYIVDNFTKEEQPKIMTVYSLCLVMGPVIGPIFGGYIVQNMSWRWIFYINVPICIIGFLLVFFLMEETKKEEVSTDYISFLFMVVGVGCLEYFLDEGNQNSWFESKQLVIVLAIGVISTLFFVWRGILGKSVVNFKVFKDANFNLSCLLVFCFMIAVILALAYFPTWLQQGYGYPVDLAGYITAPRGICAFLAAPLFITLAKYIDPRKVMFIGLFIYMISNVVLCTYGSNQNEMLILITMFLQGIGLTGTFIMLLQCTFTSLPSNLTNDGSGVFNFFRNIGNSVGTSIAATLIAREQQSAWHDMGSHITASNTNFLHWSNIFPNAPLELKVKIASVMIQKQSFIVANLDTVYAGLICSMLILWIPFALTKPKPGAAAPMMH
jgi:MFS transporter, DHA2 family, multidrug resistance protein